MDRTQDGKDDLLGLSIVKEQLIVHELLVNIVSCWALCGGGIGGIHIDDDF